ncbi:MAG: 3'-5' exonuclease [Candidatus Omnitrophica bacterium]|nr:3'-5' exonuclease [Candidatus Omnitrophota bacterium]
MHRLIIDTETTGLSPRFNKILTVGLLSIDVEPTHLKILNQNHIFIKHPHYNTQAEAMKVNKIDLVKHELHAVHPQKACDQINTFIKNNKLKTTPIVGHCIHFDKGFLDALFQQGETESLLHTESEDTRSIWKNLQRRMLIPSHLRATLGTLAQHFDIDYKKAHDALADCHITAKVYHQLLRLK